MSEEKNWFDFLKRNKEIGKGTNDFWEYFWDLEIVKDNSQRAYLKRMALDRVINFVARTISTTEFKYTIDGKESEVKEHQLWMHKLNVKPNLNENASDFWHRFIYKLLFDNEVLVIKNDSDDLLIADTFYKESYANYSYLFRDVVVDDFQFTRTFNMDEVWYIKYNNDHLDEFIVGLFGDYGELFGRMIEQNMRNGQIRGAVDVDVIKNIATKKDGAEDSKSKIKTYINEVTNTIKNKAIAIYPTYKGLGFTETSTRINSNQSVEEFKKLKNDLITDVAEAIGVPPNLVLGSTASVDNEIDMFLNFPIHSLINKIQSELTNKLITVDDFIKGHRIKLIGANKKDILDLSTAIDKLISSGAFTKNEVRREVGYEPVANGDQFVLTKNYETQSEGG